MTEEAKKVIIPTEMMQTYGVLLSRAKLMARLGMSYDDERDLYQALGYPLTLTYDNYATQYERQDIAKAVVNRPVEATWRGPVTLLESDDPEDTPLEEAWKELDKQLGLKSRFVRLDKLASLGEYGVLLLGLDDVQNSLGFAEPVAPGQRRLLYVKPLSQGSASIDSWVKDTTSERYGLPEYYKISIVNPDNDTSTEIRVHYSRVIHVTGELLESEVKGVPSLKAVYNRLKDLEKLVGGSAEMFWRGARPGYQGLVDPDYQLTEDVLDDLQDQVDEFEHNLRRILINQGMRLEPLAAQVADPAPHVDVQIQMISAVTGIPKRILTGSERGELASSEDRTNWLDMIQTRREEYAEVQIIRPFVDACIEYGVLPPPQRDGEYSIQWHDLHAPSDKEKAEVGKIRAAALKDYTSTPTAEAVVPPEAFFEFFLGLSEEQVELIQEMQAAEIEEEMESFEVGEDEVGEE